MILRLLFFALFFLSLPLFLKSPFKIPPRSDCIPYRAEWETPLSAELKCVLEQPFIYLNQGNQATVFASQDGQYVLKLFRYKRSRFPLIQSLKWLFAKKMHRKPTQDFFSKMDKTLQAAYIAYSEASPFTQVVYCHLNLTQDQLPTARFTVKRTYALPLDRFRFVLQRKVAPFKETLLAARENPERMQRLLDSLIALLQERAAQGISNSDPNLAPNFGFLEDRAVEIDFGNYRKQPPDAEELSRYFNRLEEWLKKNAPEYATYCQRT